MIERRSVIKGLGCLPLAAVLADPVASRAAGEQLESRTLAGPEGRGLRGALGVPARTPAPGVVLIHEWWGLNDQIKAVAAELAAAGYLVLAVDLFDGRVAATPEEAKALVGAADEGRTAADIAAWADWLRADPRCSGKLATMGWCFGGGRSLAASLLTPVDATVIYYGNVARKAEALKALKGPVLGHFALRDKYITPAMVEGFRSEMAAAGREAELYSYDADHAFANPTGNNFHRDDAQLAWQRTLAFLAARLGG
jgi:carboxymethylenebutenolidase